MKPQSVEMAALVAQEGEMCMPKIKCCYNCAERYRACQDTCEILQEEKEKLDAENQKRRDRARLERDFLNLATARSDKKKTQKHLRSRF